MITGYLQRELKRDKKRISNDAATAEVYLREAFLRAVTETAENFGISEGFAIEQIRGAVDVLEKFQDVCREIENTKQKK